MTEMLQEFKRKLGEVIDVRSAISLLGWDQETYMPPKGAVARGQQLASLSALAHRLFTSREFEKTLQALQDHKDKLTQDEAALVEETAYDFERATKLPESFVQRFAEETSKAYQAWVGARKSSDFAQFRPHLETLTGLQKQKADYLGYDASPYDALLEDYERGMTTAELRTIFAGLAEKQGALVKRIVNSPNQPDVAWTDQHWDEARQWDLTVEVLEDMGYDFDAGRQDKSVHPFTTNFDLYDVRVTTRLSSRELFSALTGSMHEGGHALYEQGFLECDRRTTLAEAPSLGIHESQSRMWENMIGRSRPFWTYFGPRVRKAFPEHLDGITDEQLYAAINRVERSHIRVEADECTYNLHVILRFDIEVALVEGRIEPKDVPEMWRAKSREYLGLEPPDDARGCLQDIHWSHGSMGYFPTYALGNLYAAQLFQKIIEDIPDFWKHIENGDFAPLLDWLRRNVHRIGRRMTAKEIVEQATANTVSPEPYLAYLDNKYAPLYGLST